jgi:hypothetical protein
LIELKEKLKSKDFKISSELFQVDAPQFDSSIPNRALAERDRYSH